MSVPVLAATTDVVTATYLTGNLMTVRWPAVTNATSYAFQLTSAGAGITPAIPAYDAALQPGAAQLNQVTPSSSTSTSATFTGLASSFTYSLLVTGVNALGSISFPLLTVTTPSLNSTFPSNTALTATTSNAKSTTIRYRKVVCWGLSPSAVNFAQAGSMGHRVAISMPVDLMNKFFTWTRASGEVSPTGRFANSPPGTVLGKSDFTTLLVNALGSPYNDLDGVATGLNFSSTALDVAGDIKRDPCVYNIDTDTGAPKGSGTAAVPTGVSTTHYGANDLVMAYLMYKCFGSSSYDPTDVIYNVDDAFNMLSSQQLAQSIADSLAAEDAMANAAVMPNGKAPAQQLAGDNKGQVDAMFRGFLAADPMRYFMNGVQIPGLFETNFVCPPSDPSVGGNWCLTVGDKIEVPLQLVFRAPVSVLSVQDNVQNPSSATPDSANTQFIAGEAATFDCSTQKANLANVVSIRLQISCASPVSSGTGSSSAAGIAIPLTVAPAPSVVFYTPQSYGVQEAVILSVAGGTPGVAPASAYTYAFDTPNMPNTLPATVAANGNIQLDPATGKLSFTPKSPYTGVWGKWSVPIIVTDGASKNVKVWVNVSIDDGNGASNNAIHITGTKANAGVNTVLALPASGTAPPINLWNPLYNKNVVAAPTLVPGATLPYSSPSFAVRGTLSTTPAAAQTDKILAAPLSGEVMTFKYTPPPPLSFGGVAPVVQSAGVKWSITSQSGKSGASSVLPNGFRFGSLAQVSVPNAATPILGTLDNAYLEINLDPAYTSLAYPAAFTSALAGADYSIGNTAGNVPGVYNFIVTATDDNGYSESFPVSINVALPPATAASTPLAAVSAATPATGLSYVSGNTLTYTAATSAADLITLTSSSQMVDPTTGLLVPDATGNFKWSLIPVNPTQVLPPAKISLVQGGAAATNTAVLTITPSGVTPGAYPYLITSLDSRNVQQTVFYNISIA